MFGPLLNFNAQTSVLLAGETGILRKNHRSTCHKSLANFITECCIEIIVSLDILVLFLIIKYAYFKTIFVYSWSRFVTEFYHIRYINAV